jgi:hypothetical protein
MLTICQAQVNDAELLHDMAYASYTHHFAHLWQNKDELANFLAQEYALPVLQQSLQDEGCCWLIAPAMVSRSALPNSAGMLPPAPGPVRNATA